ncbi:MAG: DUF3040 domain-containing protein [Actinomycetota bacterium]
MPLSDREQQILAEMEKNLYEEDPELAGRVPEPETGSVQRGIKIGIAVFVAGLVALIFFFSSTLIIVGVLAFAAMVTGIVILGSSLRKIFTDPEDGGPGRASRAFGDFEERLRQRYKKR